MPIFGNLSPKHFLFYKFQFFRSAGNIIQQIKKVSPYFEVLKSIHLSFIVVYAPATQYSEDHLFRKVRRIRTISLDQTHSID